MHGQVPTNQMVHPNPKTKSPIICTLHAYRPLISFTNSYRLNWLDLVNINQKGINLLYAVQGFAWFQYQGLKKLAEEDQVD